MSEQLPESASQSLTPAMRRHHGWMFWIAAAAVLLAFALQVLPDQEHVAVRGFPKAVVPGMCLSREIFHRDCPGCGLTRSVIYFAHLDWRNSWKLHHVGWLMALLIVIQLPYRALCVRYNRAVLGRRIPIAFGYIVITLLIANWVLGLVYR